MIDAKWHSNVRKIILSVGIKHQRECQRCLLERDIAIMYRLSSGYLLIGIILHKLVLAMYISAHCSQHITEDVFS